MPKQSYWLLLKAAAVRTLQALVLAKPSEVQGAGGCTSFIGVSFI